MGLHTTAADKMINELEEILADLRSGPQDHSTDIEISNVLCRLAYATYRFDPAGANFYSKRLSYLC